MHAALAPVILVGGVMPNLLLVGVVLVTALAGFMPGITWAFAAGLTANLLVGEPLGSLPLAMLLVAALVAGAGRALGRLTWIFPPLSAFAGSMLADAVALSIRQLIGGASMERWPLGIILAAAAINALLALLLVFPVRAALLRWAPDRMVTW